MYVDELQSKTIDQLKKELKVNDQPMSGTKPELVSKVADGKVLGQIPKCLTCGGGKLRFNHDNGTYKCPGKKKKLLDKSCVDLK